MGRGLALFLAMATATAALGAPSGSAQTIERTPEFVEDVNAAIDRGVAWLRARQGFDGGFAEYRGFPGATTAIAYHTLRVCGVPREDPAASRAWTSLRRSYQLAGLQTYAAACYLMAIADHGARDASAGDEHDVRLDASDRKWAAEIVRALEGAQADDGTWSYLAAGRGGRGDHSNTQYALLGLKCGARCGIRVDGGVWRRSLDHFLETQESSGPDVRPGGGAKTDRGATRAAPTHRARGWTYVGPAGAERTSERRAPRSGHAYASMTAAGVSSVVICRSELAGTSRMTAKLDAASERSVWDGLAWLGTWWRPAADSRGAPLDGYEYYSVERAGVLAGVEWMASLDWYGAGARALLAAQAADGSWASARGGAADTWRLLDTCFALLFLRRATVPVARGAVTRGGADDIRFERAAALERRDFEDFIDLVLARWRRSADADVRGRLVDQTAAVGPRVLEPLLVRLDAAEPAVREASHAFLKTATGLDFGFDATAAPADRERAVVAWQGWWMRSKSRLAYDPASRTIRAE